MQTQDQPRRRNTAATPDRWQKALARAFEQGITIRLESSTGMAVATSGTDQTACYATDGWTCTCRAGVEGDGVCKHRAMYWHVQGLLDLEVPADDDPATEASDDWGVFWAALYAAYPAIAPGPIETPEPESAPVAVAQDPRDCPACGGEGYTLKPGTFYPDRLIKSNCRTCRGKGVRLAA